VFPGGKRGYDAFARVVRRVADENHVPLVDTGTPGEDPLWFDDPVHMNRTGRTTFSTTIAELVESGHGHHVHAQWPPSTALEP
jgi:lysophospholipase L1-like esterase